MKNFDDFVNGMDDIKTLINIEKIIEGEGSTIHKAVFASECTTLNILRQYHTWLVEQLAK